MTNRRSLSLWLFGVVAVLYIGAVLQQPPAIYDEGLIVQGAERILHGQRPYVDFASGYPPGQFYTIAFVFRMFGSSLMAERIWDSAWRLGIVAAAAWLARELAGPGFRLLPIACCAALTGATGFRLYPMISATLPFLCALCCTLAFARTREVRWIFGAGLLLGLTALYRHDLAVCAAVVVLWSAWRHRRGLVWLTAGVILVGGSSLAYLLTVIPWRFLKQAFIEFPGVNVAARHLPLSTSPLALLGNLLLPVTIIGFAAFDAYRAKAGRPTPLAILAATAALALILATQRLDTIHAFPALVVCMVIMADRAFSTPLQTLLIVLGLLCYGVVPASEWTARLRLIGIIPVSGVARADPVRIFSDQAQAVRFVQNRLGREGKLYVGTTSHSRISYNDAIFPFLAQRPQATRYDMWIPGETNSASVQAEIVRELETNSVHLVVLFDAPSWNEPNLSSVDSGIKIVDTYLSRQYREVAVFGSYRILERVA